MQSLNIENVNKDISFKILQYLQWKLKHRSVDVNATSFARFFKITVYEAEEILRKLYEKDILRVISTTHCPECFNSYMVDLKDINTEIVCIECNNSFTPNMNKRLLVYSYRLNEESSYLKEGQDMPVQRQGIIQVIKKKEKREMIDKKIKVFLSYSHKDESFKNKLDVHLAPLKRSNKISTWNDRKLVAGTKFDDEIKKHLNEDDMIILLVSADFINSDYCYEIEMSKALERMEKGEAVVIPIILRPCLWYETPLKDIQALPMDAVPVSKYSDEDDAYFEIVQAINKLIDDL